MKPWKEQKGKLIPIKDLPADGNLYDVGHKTKACKFVIGDWLVYHYKTEIIYCNEEYTILDAGGYRSEATRRRLNFYCNPNKINVELNDKGDWIVEYMNKKYEFKDGLILYNKETSNAK